ncbi:MAG: hypothetical protein VYB54_06955 [Pseudomonadota bacterium]|nr:hypothetical protein [Pseudomonadota bacterium]
MEMGFLGWVVVTGILFVLPLWRIADRAGLDPKIGLFALIPFAGVPLAMGFIAFKAWPAGEQPVRGPFAEIERAKGQG